MLNIFHKPTHDAGDADHLAILLLFVGILFAWGIPSAAAAVKIISIAIAITSILTAPLLWLRVPHAKWGGVLAAALLSLSATMIGFEKGFTVKQLFFIFCPLIPLYWFAIINYAHRSDGDVEHDGGDLEKSPNIDHPSNAGTKNKTTLITIKIRDEVETSWWKRLVRFIPAAMEEHRLERQRRWHARRLSGEDPDYELVGRIIDQIAARDWPQEDTQRYVKYFKTLKREERLIWATWIVQMEVQNGGLGQYFWNLRDECYITEARNGFQEFKAHTLGRLFENAVAMYSSNRNAIRQMTNWDEYVKLMGVVPMDKELSNIHGKFLDRMEEFYSLRAGYIRKNKHLFAVANEKA